MQYQSRAAQIAQADLELELHVDPKTAARIREMHAMKQRAVQREDYDEAKRVKDAIERIRQLGSKIAQLEAYKAVCPCFSQAVSHSIAPRALNVRCQYCPKHSASAPDKKQPNRRPIMQAAVEREDYEEAKRLKTDVDKLRSAGELAAVGPTGLPAAASPHPDDIFNRALGKRGAAAPPFAAAGIPAHPGIPPGSLSMNALDGALPSASTAHVQPALPKAYSEIDSLPVGPAPDAALAEAGPDAVPMTANGTAPPPPAVPADIEPPPGVFRHCVHATPSGYRHLSCVLYVFVWGCLPDEQTSLLWVVHLHCRKHASCPCKTFAPYILSDACEAVVASDCVGT